jgi:hypothetical protein
MDALVIVARLAELFSLAIIRAAVEANSMEAQQNCARKQTGGRLSARSAPIV